MTYFEDNELSNKYKDLATIVNQVESSNGIDVMIENAFYDGTNVILTYAIQTESNLGNNPKSEGFLDIKQANGIGGTGSIEKINNTTYVGMEKVTPHFKGDNPEKINIHWKPKAFKDVQTNKQFEGDWNFEFTLAKLTTNVQLFNQTTELDGITLVMKSLEQSEMASVLNYEFYVEESILQDWEFISIEIVEAKDDLGNVYKIDSNGGISKNNGASNEWRATLYSLEPNATSLTLTPIVYYSKDSGKGLEKTNIKSITIDLD